MFSKINKLRLTKAIPIILLLLCLLLVTGCASAPSRGWSGPLVSEGVLYVGTIDGKVIALDLTSVSSGTPDLKWDKDVGAATGGGGFSCSTKVSKPMGVYGTPVVKDGKLYVATYNGDVLYITTDGKTISDPPFETNSAIVGSPVIDGDALYVGSSNGKLYKLDLDLNLIWSFQTGDKIWSTPVVSNGVVYISSADHKLYAVDAESGKEIWHFEAGAAILSTPLVVDGTIYIGACDRKFYAIDATTGETKSVFDGAGNWFWTTALAYNGEIWVGCLDHKVYVLNAENVAEKVWEYETQGMVYAPPILLGDLIVVGSQDGRIYAINPETRDVVVYAIDAKTLEVLHPPEVPKDPIPPIFAPLYPGSDNDTVYFHAQDGTHMLYALKLSTSEVVWSFRTDKLNG